MAEEFIIQNVSGSIKKATVSQTTKTRIARLLNISRPTLYRKIRENDFTFTEIQVLKKHRLLTELA